MTISYQLYSSRNFGPLEKTLKMVADLGYGKVEGYGGLYASLADLDTLKAILTANNLTMASGHFGLDMVEDDPSKVIHIAKELGMEHVFVPHLAADKRPTADQGWRDFGERLARAGQPIREAGFTFGWHNHDFEFSKTGGAHPLDLILEGGPDLALELDVAWVVRGGQNPLDWIEKYADRLVAAHVKDIAPEGEKANEDGWADVGDGVMDWPRLIEALRKAGCGLFVVEHDNPSDDARFASRSIAYLNEQ
jgi:sugar phosphate isomerase/epimerase